MKKKIVSLFLILILLTSCFIPQKVFATNSNTLTIDLKGKSENEMKEIFKQYGVKFKDDVEYENLPAYFTERVDLDSSMRVYN